MKKLIIFLLLALAPLVFGDLILSEICDHFESWEARYIEIYNPTDSSIDLTDYTLNYYVNGSGTSSSTFDFTGSIAPGEAKVATYNGTVFTTAFSKTADWETGINVGNGDDVYELVNNGTPIDVYGVIGIDGTTEAWEYTDRVATRVPTVGTGNTTWTASEWTIGPNDSSAAATPQTHTCDYPSASSSCNDSDVTAPDWTVTTVSNITFTDSTAVSVDLSWDAATDADQDTEPVTYDLYRSTATISDTSSVTLVSSGIVGTTYTNSGLSANTLYYFKVVAANCVPLTMLSSDEVSVTTPDHSLTAISVIQTTAVVGAECYDSPEETNVVTIQGIVTAAKASSRYVVSDADGTWNGIMVYDSANNPSVGDNVTVSGTIDEYFGLTQLSSVTSFTINSSGNSYNATTVTVEGIGGSAQWGLGCDVGTEAYEGVLVTLYNVEVSSPLSNYGYWKIKDQGGTLELSCDDTFYLADIANGQTISQITGILSYGYDFYRLNPRDASDIVTAPVTVACNDSDVTAPDWAVSGVSNITFTDSTATSVALSWDAATDADQDTEPVTYDVYRHTATIADTSAATLISSEQTATTCSSTGLTAETQYFYKIVARNCVPLTMLASDELDITTPAAVVADGIYAVQFNNSVAGSGDDCYSSPDDGNPVTLTGVVMTDGFDKYFIADDVGAWNGIYVYDYTNKPAIGDEVTVTGTVDEYYGLTEIIDVTSYTNNGASTVYDSTTVTVEAIGGAGGEVACNATTESYEGVLVTFYDVVVSSATGNHGYWRIKDAAGTKEIEVDDMIYHADMPLGQALDQLTGFVSYSFDIYTINPRSADDIVLGCEGTDVTAPDWAVSGVSNIAATDPGSGARLDIDWDAATDAENVAVTYDLYGSTTSPVNIIVGNLIASDLTSTSYMNTGLTTGTTYYYKVLAKNCVPLATTSSDEATEVPTLDLTFTDICDIQAFNASDPNSPAYSLENGNSVWIKGIATVDQGVFGLSGSSIYVQTEGGCGVNVFSYEVMSISEGDTVICQGEVEEYRGTTEVKVSDTTTFTITPSGTTITPEAINTTLEENWQDIEAKEGQLVTFTGVVSYIDKTSNRNKLGVQDATETDSYGITVFWYDGTGDITWDAVADFTLGETVTVVGIVGQMDYDSPFTSYYQILVRKQSDVEKVTNLKIAGNAYSHAISWGQDDPVAGLSMSLFKNNEYKELLDSANRVMTVVTDGSGYFEFQGGLEEGVTYIVFPEAEDDDLSPAVAHWIDGVITGSYYPLISDLSADVTDVVVDMVDYVDIVTADDTVFAGPVTLEWNLYTGNGLTDNWVAGNPTGINGITYVITIYELDGSGDMKPAPYVYQGLGVDTTSYSNSLPTGDYKYYVFADAYDYGGNTIPFAMTDIAHPFSVDFTPPELVTITVVDNHTLDLDFSEEVTLATAQTLANYVVTVGDINPTVASRTDTDTVRLTFASDFAQDIYTLTIEGVEDVDGNAIELSNENEGEFTITVGSPPELTAVDVVNTATLTVTFSEEVTLASSQTLGNYVVTAGDISPASATRITTNTVTLVFAAPFAQGLYLLTVEGVEDTEANAVELSGNNALNFSISVGTPPELTNTVVTDNSTLTLTFSEEVTQVTAETEANFVVTPGNITPATATRTSVTTVQLDFASLFAPDNYVITVEGVEDTDGNGVEFSGVNTGAFAIVAVNPPGIASIDVVSNTVLDVTFTEEITQATGELEGNYLVTPGDLVPSTAIRTSATVVRLTFASELAEGAYTLTTSGIEDIEGYLIDWGMQASAVFDIAAGTADAMVLYPNPVTTDVVNFANVADGGKITIYSVSGSIMEEIEIVASTLYSLDVLEYASGIYFWVYEIDGDTAIGKFAIVR